MHPVPTRCSDISVPPPCPSAVLLRALLIFPRSAVLLPSLPISYPSPPFCRPTAVIANFLSLPPILPSYCRHCQFPIPSPRSAVLLPSLPISYPFPPFCRPVAVIVFPQQHFVFLSLQVHLFPFRIIIQSKFLLFFHLCHWCLLPSVRVHYHSIFNFPLSSATFAYPLSNVPPLPELSFNTTFHCHFRFFFDNIPPSHFRISTFHFPFSPEFSMITRFVEKLIAIGVCHLSAI